MVGGQVSGGGGGDDGDGGGWMSGQWQQHLSLFFTARF